MRFIVSFGCSWRTSSICVESKDVGLVAEGEMMLHARLNLHQIALITEGSWLTCGTGVASALQNGAPLTWSLQ